MTEFPGNHVKKEKVAFMYLWALGRERHAHSSEEATVFLASNSKITIAWWR